jgi:hypothetical protein
MSAQGKNDRGSLVVLNASWLTRNGLRLRVFDQRSPGRAYRCCLPACRRLGQDPTVTRFRSSIPFRVRQPVDTFIPRYLSVYASTKHFESAADSYSLAATRDTEPLAKSYSGGDPTRLYSIHFQYARAIFCSSIIIWFSYFLSQAKFDNRSSRTTTKPVVRACLRYRCK